MSDEAQAYEGGGKVSVSVWSTARSGAQHKVRLTEQATPDEVELVIGRALEAHRRLEAELGRKPKAPFEGQEPTAAHPAGGHDRRRTDQ